MHVPNGTYIDEDIAHITLSIEALPTNIVDKKRHHVNL
jgi:hypothetical protein